MLQALWKILIAKRLTVFPLPLSAEENVSVGPCESVANEKIESLNRLTLLALRSLMGEGGNLEPLNPEPALRH